MKLRSAFLAGVVALAGSGSLATTTGRVAAAASSSYLTGQTLLKAHRYDEAVAAFQRAIRQKDNVALAYGGIGTAYFDQGKYGPSYKAYARATQLLPKSALMAYLAAEAALYARVYTAAVTYASRSLTLQPNVYATYHIRFLAYGSLKLKKNQVLDAQAEVKLAPNDPEAWNDLGISLGNYSKLSGSLAAFAHALRLKPGYWAYYKNRAIVEYNNRKYNAALKDFQLARDHAPDATQRRILNEAITNLKKRMHH
jgi:tetratricopeptide (TPR) repeat protein